MGDYPFKVAESYTIPHDLLFLNNFETSERQLENKTGHRNYFNF